MASLAGEDDPFKDPSLAGSSTPQLESQMQDSAVDPTLAVGRNASLTLATDSLIVLGTSLLVRHEGLLEARSSACCGLSLTPGQNKATRSIPFFNILWAEYSQDEEITIQYAHAEAKETVRPATIRYTLETKERDVVDAWMAALLHRAYGPSQRQKRIKVLVNPFGGQGKAQKIYNKHIAPILAAARCEIDVEMTTHNEHAIEIAKNIDVDKYDVIACCSGDGVPHEVFNGLGQKDDGAHALAKIAVSQLPCGSGNALSLNMNGTNSPSLAAVAMVKGLRTPLDLVSITQRDKRTLSFLSQSVGIVAETDLATEHLRWMGSARFTWGFFTRLVGKKIYPADIAVKFEVETKADIRAVYSAEKSKPPPNHEERPMPAMGTGLPELKWGTVNDPLPTEWDLVPHDRLGNFYAGNMAYMSPDANFFPASLPSDGCVDLVRIDGDIDRWTAIKTLDAISKHQFFDQPHVDYHKISAYRIIPKNQPDGYISIDGERVPFQPFQAEVHKGLGTVLSRSGHLYEARGP
ncbi:sphingoid long chain base kinase-like protein [Clohesyomyces aquaticus]|uniref:Sphingoid long chain base kinase-like protein n=1 Tax=Clohesyomyces aquaticus TaxID=1231657 RepID=A0A1Y1Z8R7_9PLEO|nr:sphingoid long chain base kinase-like protein [Clohesyomyces aquaticus]